MKHDNDFVCFVIRGIKNYCHARGQVVLPFMRRHPFDCQWYLFNLSDRVQIKYPKNGCVTSLWTIMFSQLWLCTLMIVIYIFFTQRGLRSDYGVSGSLQRSFFVWKGSQKWYCSFSHLLVHLELWVWVMGGCRAERETTSVAHYTEDSF